MTELTDRERIEMLERELIRLAARLERIEGKNDRRTVGIEYDREEYTYPFVDHHEGRRADSEVEAFATDWS